MFIAENLGKDQNIHAWKGMHNSIERGGNVN